MRSTLYILTLMVCILCMPHDTFAQRISHTYNNVSLSEALLQLNSEQKEYVINFLYNELEDFRVTATIKKKKLPDAIQQMIGFYPVRMTVKPDDHEIYVECTHKTNRHLTGTIIDEQGQPMAYANIAILNPVDSTLLGGGVSNESGYFAIPYEQEKVLARISYVGYKTIYKICDQPEVGTIRLQPETIKLNGVQVKGYRPVTAIKGDALVTNVAGTQLEHAGTANDVLTQVPMVLGRDGNFQVFGKGTPAIYINGREVLDMAQLSQLNSADIKNVEVITNPGAKYNATVKSVIRIRTKRPQGDGFSGTIRTQGVAQKFFRSVDQANFKFRTGGLELFGNFGYLGGKFPSSSSVDMLTQSSVIWNQKLLQDGHMRTNEFFGKTGFSYMFNDSHSVGAYYSNGFTKQKTEHTGTSRILADALLYDNLTMQGHDKNNSLPKHHANLYYNGELGKLGIDFNTDYMWRKSRADKWNNETSENQQNSRVNSLGVNRSRLFAEKLVFSYPFWKGGIEFGEEYTTSRFSSDYTTDAALVNNATSRVDENNIAGFFEIGQSFGNYNVSVGMRYEHVKFDYLANGQKKEDQSKGYNNLFPSLSLSTRIKDLQLSMSYTHKTQRPSYADLDGTVDYINRFTLEGGNPFLKQEKIHAVELTGAWHQFFGQVTYTYLKDPILDTSRPYGDDAEVKLITKDNFPEIQKLQAFVGAQFQMGIWQPKVNVGIMKQWLTIEYINERKSLNNPIGLFQLQNAIHLPYDAWLNVDMQWMTAGNDDNTRQEASSYMNVKLYKAFFRNRFSVTLEANDIFNKGNRNATLLNKDVTVYRCNTNNNRTFMLTLQYSFNSTRDRYRGQGAGTNEMNRF